MKKTWGWVVLAGCAALAAAPVKQDVAEIDVLFTSDPHGGLAPSLATFLNPEFPPPLGGGASAAAYVRRVRAEAAAAGRGVLVLESGDLFQGTPIGQHTAGAAVIEWMNEVGYDAAALGNHDFDMGHENARRLTGLARFPVLVANLVDSASGERVPWVRDFVLLERAGLRVGVLGYITESTPEMAFERNVAGLEFRPVAEQLASDVRRVREAGAELVLVLLHAGLPHPSELQAEYRRMVEREARGEPPPHGCGALEIARTAVGVDAIFAGHTHQGYDRPWEDPVSHVLVFEPYGNLSSLGHVTLRVDRATRQLVGFRTHFDRGALLTLLEDEVWPETDVSRRIAAQVGEAEAGLDRVLGETRTGLRRGSPEDALLGHLVADAFREETAADFAIQNSGGVRADLPAGPITARLLLQALPFSNQMVVVEMPGAMLRGLLEDKVAGGGEGLYVSGGRVRVDPGRPDGERIVELQVAGAALDAAATYRVAMTDYLAEGNSGLGRLRQLPPGNVRHMGASDRDVVARYIEKRRVLDLRNDGRWIRASVQ
jgi:2',3'-cyclic-nucleotide 2'-phosphodiesterase (5'-nucleotidase family)